MYTLQPRTCVCTSKCWYFFPLNISGWNVFESVCLSATDKGEQFLLAFSMYVNVPLITTSRQPKGAYTCLNGLRVCAFVAVILGHTYALGTIEYPPTIGKWSVFITFAFAYS